MAAHSSASRYGKSLAGCMHHARVSTDERLQRSPMHAPVLVLNASYEPINVCAARRAIVLVLKGVAMTEEENGHLPACRTHCHPCAVGDSPAGVPPHSAPDACAVAQEHPAARPQHLPILREVLPRANSRSTTSSRARAEARPPGRTSWPAATLQSQEGKQLPTRQHALEPRAASVQPAHQPPHHAPDGTFGYKWQKYLYY